MKKKIFLALAVLLFVPGFVLFSQDADPEISGFEESETGSGSFGFGNEETETAGMPSVKIGGEISGSLLFFTEGFGSSEKAMNMEPGDILEAKLNVSAQGKIADGIINLKIKPDFSNPSSILSIDEAFLRAYFGPVDLETGLRKVSWGRADSFGPLDVINPLDFTDLSDMGNPRNIKIARPMIRASWNINSFSKLEAIFIPWFKGNEYAMEGRWAPSQITGLPEAMNSYFAGYLAYMVGTGQLPPVMIPGIQNNLAAMMNAYNPNDFFPKTNTLEYAQAGLRFTTNIGPVDLGAQYYFGRLPRPAYSVDVSNFAASGFSPSAIQILVKNNYYHHIGIDYAQVIAGFNIRAEAGANITSDLKGDDGAVYNPHLVWSLGFDRDVIWGININLQGNGLVRLMHDKIGNNLFVIDTEADRKLTSTRITAIVSKKLFRDELELKATALWGIEDKDFLIIPAIVWSKNDITAELSAGIFTGDKAGELGQYHNNSYIKTVLSWSF